MLVDPSLVGLYVFHYSWNLDSLVYVPAGSKSDSTRSFGCTLKELVRRDLKRLNAIPPTQLSHCLETGRDAMRELDQMADMCGKEKVLPSMENILSKITHIIENADKKMADVFQGIRALSQKEVEDAKSSSPLYFHLEFIDQAYRGSFEGTPVMVFCYSDLNARQVAAIAWQIKSIIHPHVAKIIGWCQDEKTIVVEGGEGQSIMDRINQGLGWDDCCKIGPPSSNCS